MPVLAQNYTELEAKEMNVSRRGAGAASDVSRPARVRPDVSRSRLRTVDIWCVGAKY